MAVKTDQQIQTALLNAYTGVNDKVNWQEELKPILDDLNDSKINWDQRGVPNGVAPLDSNGIIPLSNMGIVYAGKYGYDSVDVIQNTGISNTGFVSSHVQLSTGLFRINFTEPYANHNSLLILFGKIDKSAPFQNQEFIVVTTDNNGLTYKCVNSSTGDTADPAYHVQIIIMKFY